MQKNNHLENNAIYLRIIEYRIDFAYTRQAYFNSFIRISKQNKRIALMNTIMGLFAILISIFTLSALTYYLVLSLNEINIIYIVSGLSIISLIISIYLFRTKPNENSYLYLEMAETYSCLYKKTKNFEALCQSELEIDNDKLREKLNYFENEQEKLLKMSLEIRKEDYDLARENIINNKNYNYDNLDKEYT
jgi:hypothetical protein